MSLPCRVASLEAFAQARAFCPTGAGGGIDNSCSSSGPSGASAAAAKVAKMAGRGASRKELQAAIQEAIVGKSGLFKGYTPGSVLPSEMCQALGIKVANEKSLDELMASSWWYERDGIAGAIAQLAIAKSLDAKIFDGVEVRIDTMKTAGEANNDHWSEYDMVEACYFPATNTIHMIAGGTDADPAAQAQFRQSGYLSSSKDAATVVHELAHRDHYRQINKATGLKTPRQGASEAEQMKYLEVARNAAYDSLTSETLADPEWKARFIEKARGISFYATTDPFELVAEYTTAVRLGDKKNDPDLDRFCRSFLAPVPRRIKQ